MNAVIYARYSSDKQTEQSIEGQVRVCKEFAERNGYSIIDEYFDRAKTGTKDNRPSFLQMIEDAEKKEFSIILVYKFDRFARNQYDSVVYKHKLKQLGVKVVSCTEAISDSPEGKLMEGLLEMMAEMYSTELGQKTKRGMRESMIKGNFIGGHILYGYKVVDKKIHIDDKTAPAIEYLFREYADGKSKTQIIEELNAKGYRTKNNKLLTIKNFQNTLSNIKYTGVFDNGDIKNDEYYPAIITKDLFDRVQERLKEHKHLPPASRAKIEYLLTGKVICGHCGANMVGVSGTGRKGKIHSYYVCSDKHKKHTCDKNNENKESLERDVVVQTLEYVLKAETIDLIAKGMLKECGKNKTLSKMKEFEKRLETIEKDLDKCFDNLFNCENEEMKKRFEDKADSLTLQKQDTLQEIQKLKLVKMVTHTEEEIKALLMQYLDGDVDDIDYQRRIIRDFVSCVYVFDDKLVTYYKVFGDKKRTLEETLQRVKEIENNSGSYDNYNGEPNYLPYEPIIMFDEELFAVIIKRLELNKKNRKRSL